MTATDQDISAYLLRWYDTHARQLPWRVPPDLSSGGSGPKQVPDPYRIWLSEIMLQQTSVAAVKPYYAEFTRRWGDIASLAQADEAEIMAAWAGLGYYSRARNLIKCARIVAEMGGFPADEAQLRKLPGIGPYTAAAIAAIAFGQRAIVVDANVTRVVARLFAVDQPLPKASRAIREYADRITPDARAGDFAQAMMDLGATICIAGQPRCDQCPLRKSCRGYDSGDAAQFPVKPPKRARPRRRGRAYWIEDQDAIWLVRRPGDVMLGGMRALPDDGWSAQCDGSANPPLAGDWQHVGSIRHIFTHAELTLDILRLDGDQLRPNGGADHLTQGEWWPVAELDQAGLPSLFAKAVQLVQASGERASGKKASG